MSLMRQILIQTEPQATRGLAMLIRAHPTETAGALGLSGAVDPGTVCVEKQCGERRADIWLSTIGPAVTVGTEAKIDAHVDVEQLVDLARQADLVILLVTPDHTGVDSAVDRVLRETGKTVRVCYWNYLLGAIPNPVSDALAADISELTTRPSTKVRITGALCGALPQARSCRPGWHREIGLTTDKRPCIQLDSPTERVRAQLEGPRNSVKDLTFTATIGFRTDVGEVATLLTTLYRYLRDNPDMRKRLGVSQSMSHRERGDDYGVPPWCARGYPDYLGIKLRPARDVPAAIGTLEKAAYLLEEIADSAGAY